MLTNRIIPCLDIKNGRTVKGISFQEITDAGDPVELAIRYAQEGADELVFLDICATEERRKTLASLVKEISRDLYIPFTVGGGIGSIQDVHILLNSGADKISVNTAAFQRPKLLDELVQCFGSQCIVLAIDIRFEEKDWLVYLNGGHIKTTRTAIDWAREATDRGVGEILLTSMNQDGTENGFSIDIIKKFSTNLAVPIIASGGAGTSEDFLEVFKKGKADAALAASVFHYGKIKIPLLKKYLHKQGIPIRLIKTVIP